MLSFYDAAEREAREFPDPGRPGDAKLNFATVEPAKEFPDPGRPGMLSSHITGYSSPSSSPIRQAGGC